MGKLFPNLKLIPIILSVWAFRLGLSEDTQTGGQLSVLAEIGGRREGEESSSLSAAGYLTAANELLPTQELQQATDPGPRSLLSLITGLAAWLSLP